jgi:polysaccharide deacetylase family protein (PEP-CTERM system associated)
MKILTFDIEDWFHILDNDSTKSLNEWKNYESRIHKNTERVLSLLNETNKKATFFCLGWVAERYPEIIREIVSHGYEIGSHTRMHQLAYEQNRDEFKKDVEHSIKILENISGQKVKYFRAPGFSITEKNLWAFEILYELGIEIDSSVFPAERAHGGIPGFGVATPSIIEYQGIKLKEFPINTIPILSKNIVFSGGGYFRLFPYFLINKWSKKSPYIMTYFHPRDFDYKQPLIQGLSPFRRFKTYVGLKKAEPKLRKWLNEYPFIDLGTANKLIDWNTVKTIHL